MSEETKNPRREPGESERKKKTREEKQIEHMDRIRRTLAASFLGIATGIISFYLQLQEDPLTGILLVLVAIIVQKYLFIPLRKNMEALGPKDWFYQGFMTVAFWFITWTILRTADILTVS
ncbi:MAG: hypothetical protein LUP99_03795 [Methanomicrobiales archaeon]|nr:hypothetical protein [Methanomicrobiales archaeon]